MLTRVLRVLVCYLLASLAAALVVVLFVRAPAGLFDLPAEKLTEALPGLTLITLAIATHIARFAAPFAFLGIAAAEWRGWHGWFYYTLLGFLIGGAGLFAQSMVESGAGPTILNTYAALSFATAGAVGGFTYWLLAGRSAGGAKRALDEAYVPTPAPVMVPVSPAQKRTVTSADDDEAWGDAEAWDDDESVAVVKTQPAAARAEPAPFHIEPRNGSEDLRLVSSAKLVRADFASIAEQLGTKPFRARKIGFVAGRKATEEETVVTEWNGTETMNVAEPGDWIVTNMSTSKAVLTDTAGNANTYVIKAERFPTLYEPVPGENEHGQFFRPKSAVEAVFLPAGFDIVAPWGERQRADKGYLILNGNEVYGNHAETFDRTYESAS